jgi:hypothetical protein
VNGFRFLENSIYLSMTSPLSQWPPNSIISLSLSALNKNSMQQCYMIFLEAYLFSFSMENRSFAVLKWHIHVFGTIFIVELRSNG